MRLASLSEVGFLPLRVISNGKSEFDVGLIVLQVMFASFGQCGSNAGGLAIVIDPDRY
jgi:hypothetical protein